MRFSFQGVNSIVSSESACGQNPSVNTQNHRGMQEWREFQTYLIKPMLQAALTSKLDQATQEFFQTCFENLQGQRFPILSEQPVPVLRLLWRWIFSFHPFGIFLEPRSIVSASFFMPLWEESDNFLYHTPLGKRTHQLDSSESSL